MGINRQTKIPTWLTWNTFASFAARLPPVPITLWTRAVEITSTIVTNPYTTPAGNFCALVIVLRKENNKNHFVKTKERKIKKRKNEKLENDTNKKREKNTVGY